jgi:hypothetical protein
LRKSPKSPDRLFSAAQSAAEALASLATRNRKLEQIAGKVIGITAAKSLRRSRFQTRSIIETNAEAGVREYVQLR